MFRLSNIRPKIARRAAAYLGFFSLAALSVFFSGILLAQEIGLLHLVLISPYLDWSTWVISASVHACIALVAAGDGSKWIRRLGVITLSGAILEVLTVAYPQQSSLFSADWLGGLVMSCSVIGSTAVGAGNSKGVFSVSPAGAARIFLTFLFALIVPVQVWAVASISPVTRASRSFPIFGVFQSYDRMLALLLPVTTLLFVLLVTEWLWLPAILKASKSIARFRNIGSRMVPADDEPESFGWKLLAILSIIAAAYVSSYRWLRTYPLGDDSRYYSFILDRMHTVGIEAVWSTERPLFFLGLYAVEKGLGIETSLLLQLMPMALAMVLVATTYLFARFLGATTEVAALASMLVAAAPHTTVGSEYYIVANWLALPLMLLFFCSYLRSTTRRSIPWAALTVALSVLTLGVHYFTWIFMNLVAASYFLVELVTKRGAPRRDMVFQATLVLSCVVVIVPAVVLAYALGGRLLVGLGIAGNMLRLFLARATPMNFVAFLRDPERVYNYFGREHYAIPLLYLLALVGFARIGSLREDQGRLIKIWFAASCVGILVVHYNEWWRFLYMVPMEILTALGFFAILGCLGSRRAPTQDGTAARSLIPLAMLLASLFTLGLLVAFTTIPSSVILLSLIFTAIVELRWPTIENSTVILMPVCMLALEQISRALYVLN